MRDRKIEELNVEEQLEIIGGRGAYIMLDIGEDEPLIIEVKV